MSGGMVALGDVAQFINGAAFKPEDWGEDGLPIIRIQNLTDPSKPYNRTTRVVAEKLHVQPGDLLVSWSATLGVFVWDRNDVGLLNQHIFRVVPDDSKVTKPYLRHSLTGALAAMQRHLHGATMQHVNRGEFLATPLYLPPLEEQRRIAAILDQADTLRTQRRAALAQLDSLTQSLFLDMFGDPVTNPKGWPKHPVGILGKIHTGKTPPSQNAEYFEGQIPFVTPGDLDSELESTSRSLSKDGADFCTVVRAGSALVGCIGNIGKIGKARVPSTFNQQINAIEWGNTIDDDFGIAALSHARPQMLALSSSTTLPILNKSNFSKVEIVVPPLPLQQTFATRVQAIEALKAQHRAALAEADALFAALQQRAFAGEL